MQLYWCQTARPNVGDALNVWLWPRVLPALANTTLPGTLYGIGSILDERLNSPGPKYILGSGARRALHGIDAKIDLRCFAVRGPLTANALALPAKFAAIDPAVLVSRLYPHSSRKRDEIGYVPYFASPQDLWSNIAERLGMRFISPHLGVEEFLDALDGCRFVITEAMHGAILADALRIPWFPIGANSLVYEGATNDFKWTDWCKSVDLDFQPRHLPPLWPPGQHALATLRTRFKAKWAEHCLRAIIAGKRRYLSADGVFNAGLARLDDAIGEFDRLLARDML